MYVRAVADRLEDLADADLIRRFKSGDDEALEVLLRRHADDLYRFCCHLVPNREDAEDICQESLARAIDRVESLQSGAAFRGWLFRIARNLSVDALRTRWRTCPLPEEEVSAPPLQVDSPQHQVEAGEERQTVTRAFGNLIESHQKVLVLREVEGLSYADIADRLNLSQSAVETLLFRARRRLRQEYTKSGATLPGVALLGLRALAIRLAAPVASGAPSVAKAALTAALLGGAVVSAPRVLHLPPAAVSLHALPQRAGLVQHAVASSAHRADLVSVHAREPSGVARATFPSAAMPNGRVSVMHVAWVGAPFFAAKVVSSSAHLREREPARDGGAVTRSLHTRMPGSVRSPVRPRGSVPMTGAWPPRAAVSSADGRPAADEIQSGYSVSRQRLVAVPTMSKQGAGESTVAVWQQATTGRPSGATAPTGQQAPSSPRNLPNHPAAAVAPTTTANNRSAPPRPRASRSPAPGRGVLHTPEATPRVTVSGAGPARAQSPPSRAPGATQPSNQSASVAQVRRK